MNKPKFFTTIRPLFGKLTDSQVKAIEFILSYWEAQSLVTDIRQFAYILATIQHETANTMLPIEEYGRGKGLTYGTPDPVTKQVYYGRGYIQLTWKANYEKFAHLLGANLIVKPELALNPDISIQIAFIGMKNGMFTGKKLDDYIYKDKIDFVWARSIVNGKRKGEPLPDKAELIASYAKVYWEALR